MKYSYSDNEEEYTGEFDSPEEAAMSGFHESDENTKIVYVGQRIKPDPAGSIDLRTIFEEIINSDEEGYGGDWAQDWVSDITDYKKRDRFKELEHKISVMVREFLVNNKLEPDFFNIEYVTEWERLGEDKVLQIIKP